MLACATEYPICSACLFSLLGELKVNLRGSMLKVAYSPGQFGVGASVSGGLGFRVYRVWGGIIYYAHRPSTIGIQAFTSPSRCYAAAYLRINIPHPRTLPNHIPSSQKLAHAGNITKAEPDYDLL